MEENSRTQEDGSFQISRRSFFKGAAIAAVGASGIAALAGCAPTKNDPKDPTDEGENNVAQPIELLNPQDESFDACTTDFAALFNPIKIGHLTLKNRIIKATAGSDTNRGAQPGKFTENALAYYERFAKGGAAMVGIETGHGSGLGYDPTRAMTISREQAIATGKELTDRIHKHGSYIFYQISAPGGPTDIIPASLSMTIPEIDAFVKTVGERALLIKEAGFDGIEIKGSTGDGLNAFLTRRQNKRTDEYGPQNLENRTRLYVRMIKAVKETCGSDFLILTLINALEIADSQLGGDDKYLTIAESKEIAKVLEATGAHLVQVRVGAPGLEMNMWALDLGHAGYRINGNTGFGNQFDYSQHMEGLIEGRYSGCASFIKLCREMKGAVKVPVGCSTYMDPRTAPDLINNAVANGDMDLVFINRPLTIEPELPNLLKAGKRDEIAPCCRCMHCHRNSIPAYVNSTAEQEHCRVNATTQYAYFSWDAKYTPMPEGYELPPMKAKKKVMVVGAGPAGLEAARIAAARGHSVTLYEKENYLGGLVYKSMGYKSRHERLQDLLDYFKRQLELKGVTVNLSTEVTSDIVKQAAPDVVVVATGGIYDSRLKAGSGSPAVVNIADGIADPNTLGEKIIICGANAQAIDLCMYLQAYGKKVTMVHEKTSLEIDLQQSPWYRAYLMPAIYSKGTRIYNSAKVDGLGQGVLNITTDVGLKKALACDTVIECWDMLPNTKLSGSLSGVEVKVVGDAEAPFNIRRAIHTGNVVARNI